MIDQRIILVGAGGLGITAAWGMLARADLLAGAELLLVDPDRVELSNLNRQVFFSAADLTRPKSEVLAERLESFTGAARHGVRLTALCNRVDESSIEEIFRGAALVVDACDSPRTKFLINDYCVPERIALCYAGVIGTAGMALAISADRPAACLRCVFGDLEPADLEEDNSCRTGGVLGPMAGLVGFIQADLALRALKKRIGSSVFMRVTSELATHCSTCVPDPACLLGCGMGQPQLLDIRQKRCPNTFLYAKLALEQISNGSLLDVRVDSETTASSVAEAIQVEGYGVTSGPRQLSADHWRLLLAQRPAASSRTAGPAGKLPAKQAGR